MIIGTVTVTRTMLHAAAALVAAVVSSVLAVAGLALRLQWQIPTPVR
jgi:hypothetical protein